MTKNVITHKCYIKGVYTNVSVERWIIVLRKKRELDFVQKKKKCDL